MLGAYFNARIKLRFYRLDNEWGAMSEKVGAESVKQVDVFVAVDVPKARALGTVYHDRINQFLGKRAKTGDRARISKARAVFLGEFLG